MSNKEQIATLFHNLFCSLPINQNPLQLENNLTSRCQCDWYMEEGIVEPWEQAEHRYYSQMVNEFISICDERRYDYVKALRLIREVIRTTEEFNESYEALVEFFERLSKGE